MVIYNSFCLPQGNPGMFIFLVSFPPLTMVSLEERLKDAKQRFHVAWQFYAQTAQLDLEPALHLTDALEKLHVNERSAELSFVPQDPITDWRPLDNEELLQIYHVGIEGLRSATRVLKDAKEQAKFTVSLQDAYELVRNTIVQPALVDLYDKRFVLRSHDGWEKIVWGEIKEGTDFSPEFEGFKKKLDAALKLYCDAAGNPQFYDQKLQYVGHWIPLLTINHSPKTVSMTVGSVIFQSPDKKVKEGYMPLTKDLLIQIYRSLTSYFESSAAQLLRSKGRSATVLLDERDIHTILHQGINHVLRNLYGKGYTLLGNSFKWTAPPPPPSKKV